MTHICKFKPLGRLWPLAAITLLLPGIALAGGKATLIATAQPMQIEGQTMDADPTTITMTWRDTKTLRMDFGDPSNYLIMRDGKTYSISQSDGDTQVMDMAGMSAMIQAMSNKGAKNDNPFGSIDAITATNTNETVAGIQGRVYQVAWTEPDGNQQSGDAVLTDEPLVVEMTHAYINSMVAMVGAEHIRVYQDALPDDDKGLLKMADQFSVESISHDEPSASLFELPAKPMDLQSLMGGLGQ